MARIADSQVDDCPLCRPESQTVLWRDAKCCVIAAPQPHYPGLCRVIWQQHVPEMTDLSSPQREHLMNVVWAVESALRLALQPAKINLASLGNQVPHLHWHVIPRYPDDPHFPDAVWATARREVAARTIDHLALAAAVRESLAALPAAPSA